ncbi:MAG TPA: lysylphosphatidylglycerol synthase domain-containing protein, partial [Solirubrobacteraceae bacterium]
MRRRSVRVAATSVVTGLCIAYLVWKIDVRESIHEIASADFAYLALALLIMAVTVLPMAWRWQRLLRAQGVRDRLPWLTRS